MRFYDPTSGAIRLDGVDLRQARLAEVRARLAIVPQDVTIFAASIHDNIAFGQPNASREAVRQAAIAAQADEFISRLENGYDTMAGERGVTLSGGQRQRIAIARAILKMLRFCCSMKRHQLWTRKVKRWCRRPGWPDAKPHHHCHCASAGNGSEADRILVMEDGQIVEEGTHQQLVAKGGLYASLAKLQFEAGSQSFIAAQ